MRADWPSVELNKLVDPNRGISYGIVQPGKPVVNGVSIIRVGDVRDGRIKTQEPLRVAKEIEVSYSRTRLKGGELLITIVGTVGETAIVPEDLAGWNVARAIAVLPVLPEIGAYWVKLALNAPQVRTIIQSRLNTTVQATLNLGDLAKLPIALPPQEERKRITHILGALDDKIELNRRMNETLEAMARAIFKDWFVDFGPTRAKMDEHAPYLTPEIWKLFPGRLDEDGRPEGWIAKSLETLFHVKIGRTPPRNEPEHFVLDGTGRPWISIKDMGSMQSFAFNSSENLTEDAVRRLRIPIVPNGTVVVSFKLTVGRVAIAAVDLCTNEAIAHFVPKTDKSPKTYFLYEFLKYFDYSKLGSTSSIATAVNSNSLRQILITDPGSELLQAYEDVSMPLFQRIRAHNEETAALSATLNLLLPKFMSGEIRIKDAEKIAEHAL